MSKRPHPTDELTFARLQELLKFGCETQSHDFKVTLDLTIDRDRVEFAKDVLAFANAGGGHS